MAHSEGYSEAFSKIQRHGQLLSNQGEFSHLWYDIWVEQPLKERYPQLFSFAGKPKCSVRFLLNQQLNAVFCPTLSLMARNQLEELQDIINSRDWDEEMTDRWIYTWANSRFGSKKAYKNMCINEPASPLFKWLWGASNLGNQKFFFWLLIRDRLNTRNLLKRKGMPLPDYSYVLCNTNIEETWLHLFFECNLSKAC